MGSLYLLKALKEMKLRIKDYSNPENIHSNIMKRIRNYKSIKDSPKRCVISANIQTEIIRYESKVVGSAQLLGFLQEKRQEAVNSYSGGPCGFFKAFNRTFRTDE
ncbi:MAG: hypothetical protein GY820_10905 [Gammaproteobacteria bacterium]|nr:hypothetical protein [Gammaproteobacteria bacterium]